MCTVGDVESKEWFKSRPSPGRGTRGVGVLVVGENTTSSPYGASPLPISGDGDEKRCCDEYGTKPSHKKAGNEGEVFRTAVEL
jgi:hypothetical protein